MGGRDLGKSRTKNVSINSVVALVCQVLNLLLSFVTRTIFIRLLGVEYLGVNGLFTNILTILSFAELGIGNAIVFNMYKPLACGDTEKIKSLMQLYKKTYTVIGCIVAGAGVIVTPFLQYIIKNKPDISENITLLYLLFLANTATSYFFIYKKNILIADQKSYITLIVTQCVLILKTILQTAFLYLTHDFIIYLIIQIICTLLENIVCSFVADKQYPYLKEKAYPLERQETKRIFTDVKALALYKFGSVILNGTDNILVSMFVGVKEVGLVSNYVLLTTSCNSILQRITEAFTASVGNLNASEDSKKQYDVFKKIFFITAWIYGFASVGLAVVAQYFIEAWLGSNYLLGNVFVLAVVTEFYVKGVHSVSTTYRSTLGFFVEGKWSALLAAFLNLVLSIILCKTIGLTGIFIATPIARILSVGIVDPVLVFHKGFKKNVSEYYMRYVLYLAVFIILGIVCSIILAYISVSGWGGVLIKVIVITIVFNISMVIIFHRSKMFKELCTMAKGLIRKSK